MAKNQKSYTSEFKQQIVDLHCKAGKGITELSNEYGIPKETISTWIKNLAPVITTEEGTISLKEYKEFSNEVLSVYNEFKKRYGAIKICRELNDRNIPYSVKRVQHHTKKLEIKSIVVKKYQYQKNHGSIPDDKENILNRNFSADTVFKKLVTDITYIHAVNV